MTDLYSKIPFGDDSGLNLLHADSNGFNIKSIEENYKASYLGEFCLRGSSGQWSDQAFSLFYTEKAHPQGSNYFAVYYMWDAVSVSVGDPKIYITNGISAVIDKATGDPVVYCGIDCGDGNVLYSAYQHDYQTYKEFMIDGGRDYVRRNMAGAPVDFKIDGGKIVKCSP